MAIISPSLPVIGGQRGDGEVALRNDVDTLLTEFNGNIDDANIKSGAGINGSKLAAGSVSPDRLAGGIVAVGHSIIATTESRTNTGYGLMTTPDKVSALVVPNTSALIFVALHATWQESVAGAGR